MPAQRPSCAISVRSAGGRHVSEKEQSEALKLLRDWLAFEATVDGANTFAAVGAALAERTALIEATQRFLTLGGPESHGHRRG